MERFADRNQKYSQVFLIFTTAKICFKTEAACTPPANCRMARTKQTARRPAEMTTCPLRGIQKKPVAQASGHARQTKDDTEKRVPKVRRTEDAHGAACGRHRQADEERIRELAVKAYQSLKQNSGFFTIEDMLFEIEEQGVFHQQHLLKFKDIISGVVYDMTNASAISPDDDA